MDYGEMYNHEEYLAILLSIQKDGEQINDFLIKYLGYSKIGAITLNAMGKNLITKIENTQNLKLTMVGEGYLKELITMYNKEYFNISKLTHYIINEFNLPYKIGRVRLEYIGN